MRMRVGDSWGTMGRPTGVTNPGFAGQGVMDQQVGQIYEFSHGAPPVERTVVDRRDASTVVAAIFQPLKRLD